MSCHRLSPYTVLRTLGVGTTLPWHASTARTDGPSSRVVCSHWVWALHCPGTPRPLVAGGVLLQLEARVDGKD